MSKATIAAEECLRDETWPTTGRRAANLGGSTHFAPRPSTLRCRRNKNRGSGFLALASFGKSRHTDGVHKSKTANYRGHHQIGCAPAAIRRSQVIDIYARPPLIEESGLRVTIQERAVMVVQMLSTPTQKHTVSGASTASQRSLDSDSNGHSRRSRYRLVSKTFTVKADNVPNLSASLTHRPARASQGGRLPIKGEIYVHLQSLHPQKGI